MKLGYKILDGVLFFAIIRYDALSSVLLTESVLGRRMLMEKYQRAQRQLKRYKELLENK